MSPLKSSNSAFEPTLQRAICATYFEMGMCFHQLDKSNYYKSKP